MRYITFNPPPVLADFIRFFWVLECKVGEGEEYVHRSTADGCAELIFHYQGRFEELLSNGKRESSFISGLQGQSRSVRRFRITSDFGIFGAYLYPYALPHFFDIPAHAVSDQMLDINDLLSHFGRTLQEQMLNADSNQCRLKIMTDFFQQKFRNSSYYAHLDASIRDIIHHKGKVDIQKIADSYNLSRRQFERNFKKLAGFSPKTYARIVRFQSVFEQLNSSNSLTSLGYACGYADQSHFIRDFREFSGFSPREFRNRTNEEARNWLDI